MITASPAPAARDRRPDRLAPVADLQDPQAGPRVRLGLRAGQQLGADPGRVLGSRIVVGHDQQVRPPRRLRAHHRPLPGVPVAAGADHHDDPAVDGVPDGVDHRSQRGRLVRVVDDREEVLARVDALQPAGHRHRAERGCGRLHVPAERVHARQREHRVRHVEGRGQTQVEGELEAAGTADVHPLHARRQPGRRGSHPGDRPVGAGVPGAGDADGVGMQAGEPGAPLVVHADHVPPRATVEQHGLGLEVALHVVVEVQVVQAQVGESTDGVSGSADPVLGEGVRGDLHRDHLDAALDHHREQRLQVGCLGGGERAGRDLAGDPRLHGAHQPGGRAVRAERGLEQVAGRGLAAGAGDPDDLQPAARLPVDRRRDGAQHPAGIVDDEHGPLGAARGSAARAGPRSASRNRRAPTGSVRNAAAPAAAALSPNVAPCTREPAIAANRSPGRTSWARSVMPVIRSWPAVAAGSATEAA